MLRKIGEKEILNVAALVKAWEETHKITVDDYAILNLPDISIIVDEEWDKLFAKDVPELFKLRVCDDLCSSYFNKKEIPTYKEYMELVDKYNKAKDNDEEYKYYYYVLATMMEVIYAICDYENFKEE